MTALCRAACWNAVLRPEKRILRRRARIRDYVLRDMADPAARFIPPRTRTAKAWKESSTYGQRRDEKTSALKYRRILRILRRCPGGNFEDGRISFSERIPQTMQAAGKTRPAWRQNQSGARGLLQSGKSVSAR